MTTLNTERATTLILHDGSVCSDVDPCYNIYVCSGHGATHLGTTTGTTRCPGAAERGYRSRVLGRTRVSAHARLCTWLDASTDALYPVLTGTFVVPTIYTQKPDSRVPQAEDVAIATRNYIAIIVYATGGGRGVDQMSRLD